MTTSRKVLHRYLKAMHYLRSKGVATGLPVPPEDQTAGLCGPAALRANLAYWGVNKSEEELTKLAGGNPDDGTKPEGIMRAARALGFKTQFKDDASIADIQSWLDHGIPVIVDWFSVDEGHYSVVKAIQDGTVYMMDPEKGKETKTPVDSFERTWFDFEEGDTRNHEGLVNRQMIVIYPA